MDNEALEKEFRYHKHNGSDSQRIKLIDLVYAKGEELTASDTNTPNSGDATTDNIIANLQTRVDELEARLQALNLIN